jgi:putative transcriptional regulator
VLHFEADRRCLKMNERLWLIEKRGILTQEQVATLAGISRSAYSNVERGKGLSVPLAKKISKALRFNWKVFFEEKRPELKQAN